MIWLLRFECINKDIFLKYLCTPFKKEENKIREQKAKEGMREKGKEGKKDGRENRREGQTEGEMEGKASLYTLS